MYNQVYVLNTGMYVNEDYTALNADEMDPKQRNEVDQIDYSIWLIQIIVWGIVVVVVKILLGFIMMLISPTLEFMTMVLFGWMNFYPNLKLFLIMMVIPMFLNALQFWVQDNLLMADNKKNVKFTNACKLSRSLTYMPRSRPIFMSFSKLKRSESINANGDTVI